MNKQQITTISKWRNTFYNRGLLYLFLVLSLSTMACESQDEQAIDISFSEWKPLEKNFLGANANLISIDKPWENEALVKVTAETQIKTLRYPGGTIGNYWDWDTGALDQSVTDSLMIKWVVENELQKGSNRYTLENLAVLYKKTGIVPVFMLNMLSKDLEHSMRNLKRARAMGLPIKYVEMGNELYFNIPFPLYRYPTPESYGESCQKWIDALKVEFPEASFALVGNTLKRHKRQENWNERVLEKCTNADALVMHAYSPSGLDGRMERKQQAPGSEGLGDLKTALREAPEGMAERQEWERGLLKDENAYANMFTTAKKSLKKIDDFYLPNGMELWVTEFNIRDDNSVVLHSWAQSLILTEYYFKLLEANVTITNLHNLIGGLFGMVHTDTLSYNHLKNDNTKSLPYSLSAGGMTSKLFGDAMSGMDQSAALRFDSLPVLIDDREEEFPSLKGWGFTNGTAKSAIIVNFGFEEQQVSLKSTKGTVTSHSSKPVAPVIGFSNITSDKRTFRGTLALPPHSISVIKFD